MAMDANTMATLISNNIIAVNDKAKLAELMAYWEPICQGIIDHLKSDASVLPGTFNDSLDLPVTGIGKLI